MTADASVAVLFAFSAATYLRTACVLKGGNAMKLAYGSPRASVDLDFTLRETVSDEAEAHERLLAEFLGHLEAGLRASEARYPYVLRILDANVLPDRDPRTFPAFEIKVGFLPRAHRFRGDAVDRALRHNVVKLDVSLNEVQCEDTAVSLGAFQARVSSLNDIFAEKLRAILQQVPRKRNRPRDFFDLWFLIEQRGSEVDIGKVSDFLLEKSAGRGLDVTKAAFRHAEIAARGGTGFDALGSTMEAPMRMPTFEQAYDAVLAFVDRMAIPNGQE